MTPTNFCNVMNEVYEELKPLSIPQLQQIKNHLLVYNKFTKSEKKLFEYQITLTIHYKQIGKW